MPYFTDSLMLRKDLMRDVGQLLRKSRLRAGFSIEDVASILWTTADIYEKIERGDFILPLDMLFILKYHLKISMDWLFGIEQQKQRILNLNGGSVQSLFMSDNLIQIVPDIICVLLNAPAFALSSAAIVKEDSVFHLLAADSNDSPCFEWQCDGFGEAKQVFLQHFVSRYAFEGEPDANWSEWFTTKREDSLEINLDCVGLNK